MSRLPSALAFRYGGCGVVAGPGAHSRVCNLLFPARQLSTSASASGRGLLCRKPVPAWLGDACSARRAAGMRLQLPRSVATTAPGAPSSASAAQRVELPKNFDPASSEQKLYEWWDSSGYFAPSEPSSSGTDQEPYVVPMPPPNVTGKLHMGHAMFATLQDIMVRYARMKGRPTLWLPGTDHAGIATQMVVEKMLADEGTSRRELGRQAFEARVWEWKQQYGGFITQQLRRLGASCDWGRERFTLDEQLSGSVREAFVRLYDEGLIYKGNYLVNWSPNLQTAVSDLEVEYSEEPGSLYYFKYPVAGGTPDQYIPVATTRPETILGDTAVAVHPDDERYRELVGKELEVPMSGRRIKVIADEYVDMEFGTGALKITPGHDPNDYEIGKRFGLDTINIMNNDGSLNANAGAAYDGMDRFEARKKLWQDMEDAGLTLKVEPYTLRVPRSQRGGEIVEPLVREQWFVTMEPLATPALEAVADGSIRIVPDRFEKVYRMWLENIKDWCISRQLWWGHRIPVWYVFPDEAAADAAGGVGPEYVVARSQEEAAAKAEERYGPQQVLRQDPDVLDTWFSSGLWPFSTLGWPDESAKDLQRFYPTQVLETGHDILFFWVARMIMMGIRFTGQPPFSLVYLHGLVRDEKGRKMSKSLGNVVDPVETIGQYGCDALRYTLATGSSPGADLNLSLDKVVSNRNFTNKMWNAGKFILNALQDVSDERWEALQGASYAESDQLATLPLAERWIVSELHQTVSRVSSYLDKYDFGEAGRILYDFFWGDFADWYIEASKTRLYAEDEGAKQTAQQVLVYTYDVILRLAHPFMPFITEELWQAMPHKGEALIVARWPATSSLPVDQQALDSFGSLQATIRAVRNARAEYGVEPGRRIAATVVVAGSPQFLEAYRSELSVLASLAKLDPDQLRVVASREEAIMAGTAGGGGGGVVEVVVGEGVEVLLPMAGLFDAAKEVERLAKQEAKLQKEFDGLQARLTNKKFMDKAPENVVAEVKGQAAEVGEKLTTVQQKLGQMRAMAGAST